MGRRDLLFIVVCIAGLLALIARIAPHTQSRDAELAAAGQLVAHHSPAKNATDAPGLGLAPEEAAAVAAVDDVFRRHWQHISVEPAPVADKLAIARRLSLALTGTIPSLEDVRSLESLPTATRLAWWREQLLGQRRTADYLAERLARPLVGVEDGPFLIFRRRRFVTWLADALAENRPYDTVVRELIATNGLWTDQPATNFVTAAWLVDEKRIDVNRLASRVSRAFLGTRIDCAECHDHPFDRWTQDDFRGLADFFADTRQGAVGIYDRTTTKKERSTKAPPDQARSEAKATIKPSVPFAADLLPEQGAPRARLAAWVTDPRNKPLSRVTVNRLWGVVFGRPLVEPIDSIPLPDVGATGAPTESGAQPASEVLELLADDFARHGFDIRRTLRILASLEVFQLDSRTHVPADATEVDDSEPDSSPIAGWSVFPLTRLRSEQLAYSIAQTSSLETIDSQSSALMIFVRFVGHQQFVKRFGDAGEAELSPGVGTIPQQLLLLNGKSVHEATKGVNPINASWRVAALAPDDERAVEAAYLVVLSRRPTPDERAHFVARLQDRSGDKRHLAVEDLFWTLLNSTEFAWNH